MVAMPLMRWVKLRAMRSAASRSRTGPSTVARIWPRWNRSPSAIRGETPIPGFCAVKAAVNTAMPLITPLSRAVRCAEPVSSAGMVVSQVMSP